MAPRHSAVGWAGDLGYYSTAPLKDSLNELVDFGLLNSGGTRLSVGAVNVRSGNFAYFDSRKQQIAAEHVMASGALPPGLPPVKIDGEFYWDGGVVSNTPLQYVLDEPPGTAALNIFQVDLFSARGTLPQTLLDAIEREKEIRFSSRTRLNTDMMRDKIRFRKALSRLLAKLPDGMKDDPDVQLLAQQPDQPRSPSCISFIVPVLMRATPATMSSPASRWKNIGSRAAGMSSLQSGQECLVQSRRLSKRHPHLRSDRR